MTAGDTYRDTFDRFDSDFRHSWCADRAHADLSSGTVACGCGIVSWDPCPCHWDPTITALCLAEGIGRDKGIGDEDARLLRLRFAEAAGAPWHPSHFAGGNWTMTEKEAEQFKAEYAGALAAPPRVERLGTVGEVPGYCRKCDVFIGFAGAGVIKPPDEHAEDREWLGSHCWVCGRSREEIASER